MTGSSQPITRKTYYALGLLAVACSMAGAISVTAGIPVPMLSNIGFVLTALMLLLLAAIKGSPAVEKRRYFLCFLLMMLANIDLGLPTMVSYLLLALPWPVFAVYEQMRGNAIAQQLRLVVFSEVTAVLLRILAASTLSTALASVANTFTILVAAAHGWLVLVLYRLEADRQSKNGAV